MSAAKKKKVQSLYDGFYGKWHDEIEKKANSQVNKAIKSVEQQMQEYALRLDAMMQQNHADRKKSEAPTSHTITQRNDLEKLRDTIRKGAKSSTYNVNTKKTTPLKTNIPVISNVVKVKDIDQFTNSTHRVEVGLKSANYYSEQITTKIVGMETVDWWEYVLIYGFVKSLKLGYEYTKVKEYIEKGVQSTRTVSGQNLFIKFIPKKKNDVKQIQDTVENQPVIRESGTIYESGSLGFEVPQKSEVKTEEYRRGYFVYEDTFSTLVIDYDALNEQIDKMLIDSNVHPTLIEEIKLILKNGRLSTI